MNQDLENLYHKKESLKERIRIAEIGNDSYDLSYLRQTYETALFELNQKIKRLEQNSPEQKF